MGKDACRSSTAGKPLLPELALEDGLSLIIVQDLLLWHLVVSPPLPFQNDFLLWTIHILPAGRF